MVFMKSEANTTTHRAKEGTMNLSLGQYVLATLVGFGSSPIELRCKVEQTYPDGTVLVRTADLRDAGSLVPVNPDRVRPEPQTTEFVRHQTGNVWFG